MGLFGKSKLEVAREARLEETQRSQAAAADPATSAWVSANAGTGKTHVLTMRVLRLLLNGTLPTIVLQIARAGAQMPQKSTYFYPKLATGLVLRRLA